MEEAIPRQRLAHRAGQMAVVLLQDMVVARKQEAKIHLVAQRYAFAAPKSHFLIMPPDLRKRHPTTCHHKANIRCVCLVERILLKPF